MILDAAKIHEESWKEGIKPGEGFTPGEYTIDLDDSVKTAVKNHGLDEELWYLISLAFHWWNDLIAWAEQVAAGKPVEDLLIDLDDGKEEVKG